MIMKTCVAFIQQHALYYFPAQAGINLMLPTKKGRGNPAFFIHSNVLTGSFSGKQMRHSAKVPYPLAIVLGCRY